MRAAPAHEMTVKALPRCLLLLALIASAWGACARA